VSISVVSVYGCRASVRSSLIISFDLASFYGSKTQFLAKFRTFKNYGSKTQFWAKFKTFQNYGSKTQFWAKFKTFQKRHNLPFQGKLWPAISRQQIELESCSNPVMTSGVVEFRIKKNFNFFWGVGPMGSWQGYVFWLIIWRHHPIPRANILVCSICGF